MIANRRLALTAGLFLWASAMHAEERLMAIDVLLQPDSVMLGEASRWNARMREQSPKGFKLDEEHAPHITLVQRFVPENDLAAVRAAVDRVKSTFETSSMQMKATGLYHIPSGKIGLAGIVVEPSSDLIALQHAMIEAVNPFARPGGEASAFVPDATGTPFDPMLFKYVETFVPSQTGPKFNPHVTIGIAPSAGLRSARSRPSVPSPSASKELPSISWGISAPLPSDWMATSECRLVRLHASALTAANHLLRSAWPDRQLLPSPSKASDGRKSSRTSRQRHEHVARNHPVRGDVSRIYVITA